MVSMPSRRVSSCPVAIGNVSVSTMMSASGRPQFSVRSRTSLRAIASLVSAVLACPSSSMVKATTAAPCSLTRGMILWYLEVGPSPSSKFTEFISARPPYASRPAARTFGSVESNTRGSVDAVARRPTNSRMSRAPSRPT